MFLRFDNESLEKAERGERKKKGGKKLVKKKDVASGA